VLNFKRGNLEQALCYSDVAAKLGGVEEQVRHAKLLNAIGLYQQVYNQLDPLIATKGEAKTDPGAIYQLILANFALDNREQTEKLVEVAKDAGLQAAGLDLGLSMVQAVLDDRRREQILRGEVGAQENPQVENGDLATELPDELSVDAMRERYAAVLREELLSSPTALFMPIKLVGSVAELIEKYGQS
ncbi:MAG: hypothetical protein KDD42_04835, partial [Bdellovibrionales bacterium]|nr:hypothetical protein [Bdellovibrionales bacterium]